jgi:hypothetical protein
VPYERFLPPGPATSANLWTLALVVAWRVLLMTRVVSVLTGRGLAPSFFLVMAFADAAALAAVSAMPKPVLSLMGGVRQTESEDIIAGTTVLVLVLGTLSAPVWFVGALAAFATGRPAWQVPARPAGAATPGRGVWALAAVALAVWIPVLPWTQGEQ